MRNNALSFGAKALAPEGDRYVLVSDGAPLHVRDRSKSGSAEDRPSGSLIDLSYEGSTLYIILEEL